MKLICSEKEKLYEGLGVILGWSATEHDRGQNITDTMKPLGERGGGVM